jgi:hypothetical protein
MLIYVAPKGANRKSTMTLRKALRANKKIIFALIAGLVMGGGIIAYALTTLTGTTGTITVGVVGTSNDIITAAVLAGGGAGNSCSVAGNQLSFSCTGVSLPNLGSSVATIAVTIKNTGGASSELQDLKVSYSGSALPTLLTGGVPGALTLAAAVDDPAAVVPYTCVGACLSSVVTSVTNGWLTSSLTSGSASTITFSLAALSQSGTDTASYVIDAA